MTNSKPPIEEQFEGELIGVEQEEPEQHDSSAPSPEPYDPKLIRVDPKTLSISGIVELIRDGDLELAPDFQLRRVWKAFQKSRLIESALLRIPLPAFYFSADREGKMRVVGGLQRLSTVYEFIEGGADRKGGFALANLEYLKKDLDGKRFGDLDQSWVRRLQQTQLYVNVIDPQTPERVLFDIFSRINTGGTPLNGQEIRHCMSGARARNFLKECVSMPEFALATGGGLKDNLRMADREVVLRFCAFRLLVSIDDYPLASQMDAFLSEATKKIDQVLRDSELAKLKDDLIRALTNAHGIFGAYSFRKWDGGQHKAPINRSLFESWAVALADYEWASIKDRAPAIKDAFIATLQRNAEYEKSVTASTGDYKRVRLRFAVAREIVQGGGEIVSPGTSQ